jgi:hypothetical protein
MNLEQLNLQSLQCYASLNGVEADVLFERAETKSEIFERAYDPDLPEFDRGNRGGRL